MRMIYKKNRKVNIVALIVISISAIVIISVFIQFPKKIDDLKLSDIQSVKILPERIGMIPAPESGYDFNLNKSEDKILIDKILNEIKSGKIENNDIGQVISNGYTPTRLEIKLKNGTILLITSTVGGKHTTLSNGFTTNLPYNVKNQITIINQNTEQVIRKDCPQTKELIDTRWKKIFNINVKNKSSLNLK
jgi:hypothetical protein